MSIVAEIGIVAVALSLCAAAGFLVWAIIRVQKLGRRTAALSDHQALVLARRLPESIASLQGSIESASGVASRSQRLGDDFAAAARAATGVAAQIAVVEEATVSLLEALLPRRGASA
jgi:hypothetical protein